MHEQNFAMLTTYIHSKLPLSRSLSLSFLLSFFIFSFPVPLPLYHSATLTMGEEKKIIIVARYRASYEGDSGSLVNSTSSGQTVTDGCGLWKEREERVHVKFPTRIVSTSHNTTILCLFLRYPSRRFWLCIEVGEERRNHWTMTKVPIVNFHPRLKKKKEWLCTTSPSLSPFSTLLVWYSSRSRSKQTAKDDWSSRREGLDIWASYPTK